MSDIPARLVVERDLSVALSVLAVIFTTIRLFIRLRPSPRRDKQDIWRLLPYLSDIFIGVATIFQLCETTSRIVVSSNLHINGVIQKRGIWGIISIVVSYLAIWCARLSVLVLLLAGGRHGISKVVIPTGRPVVEIMCNLLFFAGLCAGILYQNIVTGPHPDDSIAAPCAPVSKAVGISHIVVYLIATAWLSWNAHRAIGFERRMSGFKWRIFVTSVGGDLLCTIISIIRGAVIISGMFCGESIISVLECGITTPMANMPIVVPGIYNLLHDLWRKNVLRSPSPVTFRARTSLNGTYSLEQGNEAESRVNSDIELLSLPPSPISPADSKAGSTNSLLPRLR